MDREALLGWYDARRRDLPWRRDQDPYRVWISEVMLQQTRVETVLPYYAAWMERFPDLEALADADEESVLAAWSGLGYYSRARNLQAAARRMVADGVPDSEAGWRALPGVGPYTAGAVASIAFGRRVPAVDGNVVRVMSRLFDIGDDVTRAAGRRAVQDAAAALVPRDRPGDWNQAVMELGATVCTPRPDCDKCPVSDHCRARIAGILLERPVKPAKKAPRTDPMHFAAVLAGDRVLLTKQPPGLLAGTWLLPGGPRHLPLEDQVLEQAGVLVRLDDAPVEAVHRFTHRTWHMRVHRAEVLDVDHRQPARAVRWQPLDALDELGLPTAARRALDALA